LLAHWLQPGAFAAPPPAMVAGRDWLPLKPALDV
jgi:hypothetical protein